MNFEGVGVIQRTICPFFFKNELPRYKNIDNNNNNNNKYLYGAYTFQC